MPSTLFNKPSIHGIREAIDIITNILETSTHYSIIGMDTENTIQLWNEGAHRIYGYEPDEIVGCKNVDILFTPEDIAVDKPREILRSAMQTGKWEGTLHRVRKNGEIFAAHVVITVLRDENGTESGYLLISKDISNELQLTEELKAAQFYIRILIESSIDALMTTDPLGVITDVNQQMCSVTGKSREQLIGTPFKNYFTNPQRAEDGIRKVLINGTVTNYELTITSSQGKETVVSYNATTFQGADGKLRGVFAAARDITEHKALEEQLKHKNEELEIQYQRVQKAKLHRRELLANMSHELRTPLNGIIGFSDLLHEECIGPVTHEQKEYLGDILSSSKHLLQLINNILDLAALEAGKMSFVPEPVDLKKLVSEVRDILHPLATSKRIHIKTRISTPPPHIEIDASKFKQVLYNYLSNAIKFTPYEGHVAITILPEGSDRFRVEIQDDGPGIQPEALHLLFVELQQLDNSISKNYQGIGLGLALTKRIVEAQGGNVGVQSVPGKGSTFFATLPCMTTISSTS